MNLDHPHLAPQAAALLSMTDELRIKATRTERWIGLRPRAAHSRTSAIPLCLPALDAPAWTRHLRPQWHGKNDARREISSRKSANRSFIRWLRGCPSLIDFLVVKNLPSDEFTRNS